MFSFTNKKVIGVWSSEVHCSKSMVQVRGSPKKLYLNCGGVKIYFFYIFTSENIKCTIYFINIFLYFTTLYIINIYIIYLISCEQRRLTYVEEAFEFHSLQSSILKFCSLSHVIIKSVPCRIRTVKYEDRHFVAANTSSCICFRSYL